MNETLVQMIKNQAVQPLVNIIPSDRVKSIQRCQNAIDKYLYSAEDEQNGEMHQGHKLIFDIRWKP